jgi:predicted nucleic acid-binding Zn ribbon protein
VNQRKARPTGPERAGDVARRLLRGRLAKRARRESRVLEIWEEVVGPERAARLVPAGLRAGVLWVEVESPALLYEAAQFARGEILARLKERLPELGIEDVRFRLG